MTKERIENLIRFWTIGSAIGSGGAELSLDDALELAALARAAHEARSILRKATVDSIALGSAGLESQQTIVLANGNSAALFALDPNEATDEARRKRFTEAGIE